MLLAACGGGRGPSTVWGDAASAPSRTPAALARWRHLGVAVGTADQGSTLREAEALFNWAERRFPQYFPGHSDTQKEGSWLYRAYFATGVLLGVESGQVYVKGGPFGAEALRVGRMQEFVLPPLPVLPTSYENKNAIPFDRTQVQNFSMLGIAQDPDEIFENPRSLAFADFFQDGRYAAFVNVNRHRNVWNLGQKIPDSPNKAYFLAQDASGRWVDRTSELLPDGPERDTCISASYSIVADFNNDGKPDVYVACNGLDVDLKDSFSVERKREVYLSHQVLFLSRPDGRYRRVDVPFNIYGHQAHAGDVNGDGFVDVVTANSADFAGNDITPFVLLGRGDGTFVRSNAYIPSSIYDLTGRSDGIWGIGLIPIDGRLDLVLGGGHTVWIKGAPGGGFDIGSARVLPSLVSATTGRKYLFPLDVLYLDGSFYLSQLSQYDAPSEAVIHRVEAATLRSTVIHRNSQPFVDDGRIGSEQYKPTADGHLVPIQGLCNKAFDDPAFAASACGQRIRLP
ncbi:MAG: VCBS repeat-containing protein [Rubrivivax sp.]